MHPYLENTLVIFAVLSGTLTFFIALVAVVTESVYDCFSEQHNRPKDCKGFWRVLLYNYKCLGEMRIGKPEPWGQYHKDENMTGLEYIGLFCFGIAMTVFFVGIIVGMGFLLRFVTLFPAGRQVLLGTLIVGGIYVGGFYGLRLLWVGLGKLGSGIAKVDKVVKAVEKHND